MSPVQTGPADTVRVAYDAFEHGDVEAIIAMCTDDVAWSAPEPLPHALTTSGRDGVARFFGGIAEHWDALRVEIDTIVEDGDRAIAVGRGIGTIDGADVAFGAVHVFTVRDGKVARFDEYVAPPAGGFPG